MSQGTDLGKLKYGSSTIVDKPVGDPTQPELDPAQESALQKQKAAKEKR